MTTIVQTLSRRLGAAVLAGAVLAAAPVPALGQDRAEETRIRKLEAEVRALQRKVFPGGDARFFEAEIQPGSAAAPATSVAPPSTTALTDVLARLDGLELQMQQLTARSEEQANTLSQLEERLAALENARQGAGEMAGQGYAPPPPIDRSAPAAGNTATSGNLAAMTGTGTGTGCCCAPRCGAACRGAGDCQAADR
jgi:TolA-binding protein